MTRKKRSIGYFAMTSFLLLVLLAGSVAAFDISFPLSNRIPDDYDNQNLIALLHLNDTSNISGDYSTAIANDWAITAPYSSNSSCNAVYTGMTVCGDSVATGAINEDAFPNEVFNTSTAGNGACYGGWFYRDTGTSGYDYLSALSTGTVRQYIGVWNGDNSYFRFASQADTNQAPAIKVGTWNSIIINLNFTGGGNGFNTLYVNGSEVVTASFTGFNSFDGSSNALGTDPIGLNAYDGYHSELFVFNRSCNISEIEGIANGTIGQAAAPSPDVNIPSNVSIRNALNLSAISTFNITFSNASNSSMFFSTTTGNVVTNLSDDQLYNVSASAIDHFDIFIADYNLTASQENNFTTAQGIISLAVTKLITRTNMTVWTAINQNHTNTSATNRLYVNVGLNQIKLDGTNFTGTAFNYTLTSALTNTTHAPNVTDTTLRISARDAFSGSYIINFNATINTSLNNYSIFQTTTTGNISLETENITGLNIFVDADNYTMANTTANMTTNQTNITLGLIMTNMLNASVLSERDRLPILNGSTITVLLIGDSYSTNISVTNVTGNTTFQIDNIPSGEYEIIYGGDDSGYEERRKFITITSTGFASTDLYLLEQQNATRVDFTITDQFGDELENATIKAQRYYYDVNGFLEVEAARTNFLGQATMRLRRYDVDYRFVIEYDNRTIFQSSKTQIEDDPESFNFQVNTDTPTLDNYQIIGDVHAILNYSNSSTPQYFQFLFSDANSQISQGCLRVTQIIRTGNNVTETCLTGSSGTIQIAIDHTQNSSWTAEGSIINTNGQKLTAVMMSISTDRRFETFGVFGLFIALGIILFLAGIGASTAIAHPAGTILLVIMGLIGTIASGFIFGIWTSITLVIVIGAIIVFKSRTA